MKKSKHIPAFTVLEITIVLALTSLLTALFFGALNRFNTTIANEAKIKSELNQFFLFRSNLWRELDESDSIKVNKNVVYLYIGDEVITYSSKAQQTQRRKGDHLTSFDLEIRSIEVKQMEGRNVINFQFEWKGDELSIYFPLKQNPQEIINTYFEEEKWR